MKTKIKNIIKNNRVLYFIYYYCVSCFIRIISIFIPIKNNRIIFVSYGGKRFDDSPSVIYKELINNSSFLDYQIKYAFINPNDYPNIPDKNKIKIDTFKYYMYVLSSKYWITNSSVQRGLSIKRKGNVNVLYMHGLTALKKSSKDFHSKGKQFKMVKPERFDLVFIEGKKEKNIVADNVNVDINNIYNTGLPRIDELLSFIKNDDKKNKIKEQLNIPRNKKVILYAPTYREYNKTISSGIHFDGNFDYSKWKEVFKEYVLVVTTHYENSRINDNTSSNDVIYAYNYNSINELLAISDVLISDYSNIVFDFYFTGNPAFCYGFDYDYYIKNGRGFYTDPSEIYKDGIIKDESELVNKIISISKTSYQKYDEKIIDEFILNYGDATKTSMKIFFER